MNCKNFAKILTYDQIIRELIIELSTLNLITLHKTLQVPYESCKEVPDVECITVLQDVPDLKCVPEPYTECNDIAIDIPFLEPAEECEEVVFEDCVEVQNMNAI